MWCVDWDDNCVIHENPKSSFLSWRMLCSNGEKLKVCRLLFYVITWSIRLACNEIVFNGKSGMLISYMI